MEKIEINSSNYKDYLTLEIVAFSYSELGAMGEKGVMYLISSDGKTYYINFHSGNITISEIKQICPIFKKYFIEKDFSFSKGWKMFYMGFGNYLIVKGTILDKFSKHINILDKLELYQNWKDTILNHCI